MFKEYFHTPMYSWYDTIVIAIASGQLGKGEFVTFIALFCAWAVTRIALNKYYGAR